MGKVANKLKDQQRQQSLSLGDDNESQQIIIDSILLLHMQTQQQQTTHNYEYYATQILSDDNEEMPSPTHPYSNLTKLSTLIPIQISYPHERIRKDKKTIIHDINQITKRRKGSKEKRQIYKQISRDREADRSSNIKQKQINALQTIPTPREQLQQIRSEIKESHQQNEQYLKHNLGTVKQKIRNKFLRHRVDFAQVTTPKPLAYKHSHTQGNEVAVHRTPKQRIDKYNHDFQEYLIRKRISKKTNTFATQMRMERVSASHRPNRHEQNDISSLESDLTIQREEQIKQIKVDNIKRQRPFNNRGPLYCSTDCEGEKLIIISPITPAQHSLAKFKNIIIETARKSCFKDADHLLKRYVNRNLPKPSRSEEKQAQSMIIEEARGDLQGINIKSIHPPANFIKSPLNYTLFKKQIHKIRKESIGLPLLLESHEEPTCSQSLLEQRLNAKKIFPILSTPSDPIQHATNAVIQERISPKKYVVYSKKNLQPGLIDNLGVSQQQAKKIHNII